VVIGHISFLCSRHRRATARLATARFGLISTPRGAEELVIHLGSDSIHIEAGICEELALILDLRLLAYATANVLCIGHICQGTYNKHVSHSPKNYDLALLFAALADRTRLRLLNLMH